jgi:hypothetical protein
MTGDDLWHYAKVCRVANVMRPYLDSCSVGLIAAPTRDQSS